MIFFTFRFVYQKVFVVWGHSQTTFTDFWQPQAIMHILMSVVLLKLKATLIAAPLPETNEKIVSVL